MAFPKLPGPQAIKATLVWLRRQIAYLLPETGGMDAWSAWLRSLAKLFFWATVVLGAVMFVGLVGRRVLLSDKPIVLVCSEMTEAAKKRGYTCDIIVAELIQQYRRTQREALAHLDPYAKLTSIVDLGTAGSVALGDSGVSVGTVWAFLSEQLGIGRVIRVSLNHEDPQEKRWYVGIVDPQSDGSIERSGALESVEDAVEKATELLLQIVEPCQAVPLLAFRHDQRVVARAVHRCLSATVATPAESEALTLAGQAYTTLGRHGLARLYFERAKHLGEVSSYFYLQWSVLLYASNELDLAQAKLNEAAQGSTPRATKIAYENVSGLLAKDPGKRCGHFKTAYELASKFLYPKEQRWLNPFETWPGDNDPVVEKAAARRTLGHVLTNLGRECSPSDPEAQFRYLTESIVVAPGYAPAYNALGNYYRDGRDYAEAHKYYDDAIHYEPSFGYAYLDLWLANCMEHQEFLSVEKEVDLRRAGELGIGESEREKARAVCRSFH